MYFVNKILIKIEESEDIFDLLGIRIGYLMVIINLNIFINK